MLAYLLALSAIAFNDTCVNTVQLFVFIALHANNSHCKLDSMKVLLLHSVSMPEALLTMKFCAHMWQALQVVCFVYAMQQPWQQRLCKTACSVLLRCSGVHSQPQD
jgi:hypothetical protein